MKKLYLVVRPRQHPRPTYFNRWIDDDYLESIETTIEIGDLCLKEKNAGNRVFIHRCGLNDSPPLITASALVSESNQIRATIFEVKFQNQELLGIDPPHQAEEGQGFYWA